MSHSLSNKRQNFCRLVAIDNLNPTEAYIKSFNVTSDKRKTATEAASRLMKDSNIEAMISSLRIDISDKLVWNKAMVIEQLSINVEASRNASQFAASNRSIELLGKAIGNVFEPEIQQVNGTIQILHQLPDTVLEQLESMVAIPVPIVNDTDAIEADYSIIEPDE
jgi:hypothetical protein